MKRILFFIYTILLALSISAQDSTVATITLSGQRVDFDRAERFRITWKADSVWRVDEYYVNQTLASQVSYADEDLSEITGPIVTFYQNGQKSAEGTIHNNRYIGEYKEWHDNGALSAEGTFSSSSDAEISNLQKEDPTRLLPVPDPLSQGIKTGEWKYYHSNRELSAVITYDHGSIVEAAYFEADGTPSPDGKITDRPADYEGGIKALYETVSRNLRTPPNRKKKKNIGLVKVQFTVGRDGRVTDVSIYKSVNKGLDGISIIAVKNMDDWIPALEHNRIVSQKFLIPLRFGN